MPVKIDTRKKTRKQKEKNRRRKKRNKSRKGSSLFQKLRSSIRRSMGLNPVTQIKQGSRSRRAPSMQAIHGVVANAYASRMPVGSNHTKGNYATTQNGLGTKNFFKRTLRQMKRVNTPGPPTYSYQTRPRPIYPQEVQPIGLAEPSKGMNNLFRALPAASIPRGRRQSFLREACAEPISTGLAEPGMPNWGQMYEATEEGRPRVTRAMTAAELGKEDAYTRVQADMRTGGPGPTMGIWAPSRVRTYDDSPRSSISSRESARIDGRRRLSMAEEHAFLQYYPRRTDLVAVAKIHGSEGAPARAEIRRLINVVFSNSNSNSLASSIHTESFDPLHLSTREILLLRRQGPEGVEHIRRVTSADEEIVMDQVAEAREFLSRVLSQPRSGSRSTLSRGSDSTDSTGSMLRAYQATYATAFPQGSVTESSGTGPLESLSPLSSIGSRSSRGSNGSVSTGSMLREYQSTYATAFPQGSVTESSGTGPLESLSSIGSRSSRGSISSRGSRSSRGSISSRGSRRS